MGRSQHRGDGGETGLGSGRRVRKDDLRIECVGSIDELSSFLGLAAAALGGQGAEADAIIACLARVQRDLHRLGAELADWHAGVAVAIGAEHVAMLDGDLEQSEAGLPKLRNFILPGGGETSARLHVARAVCRRVERQVVHLAAVAPVGAHVIPYLNRLSLVLFSLARKAAHLLGTGDAPV